MKIAFFRRVVPASEVADIHFHDLRHEAISRLAESGKFQLIELQAISGHRDTRMLLRYAHLCCGNLADKMDNVGAERTTKDYFHRGRRRRVESVGAILLSKLPATTHVAASETALPGNVFSLFGPRAHQPPAR